MFRWGVILLLLLGLMTACERPLQDQPVITATTALVGAEPEADTTATAVGTPLSLPPTPTLAPTASPRPTNTPAPPTLTPTPFFTDTLSSACGQRLPILPVIVERQQTITTNPGLVAQIRAQMPTTAVAAFDYLLNSPADVGLVAFQVGDEGNGVYLNPDAPMPLASTIKIIHLVAYAEAVANGELDPLTAVPLSDIEAFYQPGLDLGAHLQALEDLEASGKIYGTPPLISLEAIPTMMIRYSSNAAMDYLHLLLGQERIEATAVALGLSSQTAPCPFLGQFLAMGNFTRANVDDRTAVANYLANASLYGQEAMLFTEAYSSDADFRQAQIEWRRETRRPRVNTQRLFSENLSPHAAPRDYANLMARIALNGLSNSESSFTVRRYLEWPMVFPINQELFTNLGYKNGALPGILTTTYYAYPRGTTIPTIVILFYRDLPMNTYNAWRRNSLAHDEFARWLLYDPQAIPLLHQLINP